MIHREKKTIIIMSDKFMCSNMYIYTHNIECNVSKNLWSLYATGLALLLSEIYKLDTDIAGAGAETDQSDGAKE